MQKSKLLEWYDEATPHPVEPQLVMACENLQHSIIDTKQSLAQLKYCDTVCPNDEARNAILKYLKSIGTDYVIEELNNRRTL